MSDWTAWGVVVIVIFCFIIYDMFRRAKEKILIKCYTEIKTKGQDKTFSGLELVGEFKGVSFNKEKRCYEFRFRRHFEYFSVFCNYTMTQLMEVHNIEVVYFVIYSLNAYIFEKKLKEPYEKELGWSIQAYIYRCFCYLFNISLSGIPCSFLICGTIFYYAMLGTQYAFLIGLAVGFLISLFNYFLLKSETIQETLLKRKTIRVETEYYMSPLESGEEILDIYEVRGTIQEKVETSDGVSENQVLILQDDETVDYLTVEGYDELYELLNNPLVKLDSYKIKGMKTRKRTDQEMLNIRRSYLTRNRAFAEDLFRVKEENERLQHNYRELEIQKQYILETKDKELKEAMERMVKERARNKNTVKHIMIELMGSEFIGLNFDKTMEKVMRRIEQEKEAEKADKLDTLVKATERMFELIAQKTNVDLNELMKLLKVNEAKSNNGKEVTT